MTKDDSAAGAKQSVIQPFPPNDGNEWDCQCARCGSSADRIQCEECGGEGYIEEQWWEDDMQGEIETQMCFACDGYGHWYRCLSSPEWCEANPLPGRESVARGKIEWFRVHSAS